MSRRASVPLAVLAAVIAGCATPPTAPVEAPQVETPSRTASLEELYRQRALALAGERRWADAAVQWDLLAVLRPDSKQYRSEAEAARKRGAEAASAHVRAAEQARKRGDNEQAATLYLRALSADPGNAMAADGLKAIELERTRRAWLNRPPRIAYTPPGAAPVPAAPYDPTKDETGPRR